MNHPPCVIPASAPSYPCLALTTATAFVARTALYGFRQTALVMLAFSWFAGSAQAVETFTSRVDALAGITIAGDTDLSGPVWIGRLAEDTSAKGFKMDVFQEAQTYYEEVYHDSSYTMGWNWVEDGYYDTETTWVETYDWVNHGYTTPDEVDEFGNIINPGEYFDDWQWESVGFQEQSNTMWVSNGGHEEQAEVWQEGYYESVPYTSFGAPQVRFTGTRSNTTWSWSNPASTSAGGQRALMQLSPGGLSLPAPGDSAGASRALLTHASFEQSHTTPAQPGPYHSYGSKVAKNKIELWSHQGTTYADSVSPDNAYTVIADKLEADLDPVGLSLSSSESADGGSTMVRTTTTLTATSASFGGSVGVKGILRVEPAGDLSMGAYTNGTRP